MCVRIAIDLGIFQMIVEHSAGKSRITAKELAVRSKAEKLLIGIPSPVRAFLLLHTDIEAYSPLNASTGRDGLCGRKWRRNILSNSANHGNILASLSSLHSTPVGNTIATVIGKRR